MGVIGERLASIETHQEGIKDELRKMVSLLDRMVRVEERQANADKRLDVVAEIVKGNSAELDSWRTARKIFIWISGITSTVLGAIAIKHWG